jgi:Ca2+-binding RTX toxin-like protein
VPRTWSQLTSDVRIIGPPSEGNSLDIVKIMQAVPESESSAVPFGGPGFVPGDRTGARMLFSAAEQSIYMIGGARGSAPTSEVWRLDIATATWTHLLQRPAANPVSIRNVAAVGYDSTLGKFLVVDDAPASSPQNARLVVLDRNGNTSKVAATLNIGGFTKVGLTATGKGTFVLVGARATDWTAYRLEVTAGNVITWLGRASGTGLVLADPIPWQEGPGVFVQRGNDIDTTDLPPGAFTPAGTPPELGVCTAPLVVGTLPPVTVTSCSAGVLVPPPLASACGPVTFSHNAPAILPLGTTIVTWKFTDALGNVVTAQQSVTTQLGDDATCCPAGTNIIIGTPNNDVITGTAGNDCIIALGGQDTVNGGGGDDFISGGEGNDILNGQAGDDRIYGGGGQDTLNGGDGADQLFGGSGDDQCFGGIGNDLLSGGDGQDTLNGEDGNDTLRGDNGDDRLSGGNGNDSLDGGGNNNACSGGSGTNTFVRCQTFF